MILPPPPAACLLLSISFGLLGIAIPQSAAAQTEDDPALDGAMAVSAFGGVMTDNHFDEVLTPWNIGFRESYLAGVAVSRRFARFGESVDLEIEGQLVRHFGDQDHWEINLPIIGRWRKFPWDHVVDTSIAWGIGPSYATAIPEVEIANDGSSERLMVYWVAELELGAPDSPWSAIARIHHRSDAFGLITEGGGSNALTIGFRHRF